MLLDCSRLSRGGLLGEIVIAAGLQQIEQGRSSWGDSDKTARLRRTLVWNHPAVVPKTTTNTSSSSWQSTQASGNRSRNNYMYFSQPSKPRDKACHSYNQGLCTDNSTHPLNLHVCAYCLNTVYRLCRHTCLSLMSMTGLAWSYHRRA